MGQFDIQFAKGTPDIVQQPRANINVDTGAQAIGQAFAGLGERLYQFGQKKQQAQNALDLSKQKRRYDELNLAAHNALQNVTDDQEAQKILEQYRTDAGSLKTGNAEVDRQFEMHINDTITGVTESFEKKLKTNKIKAINDEFEVNYSGLLSSGDFDGASELIGNMQSSGAITSVKAEGLRKTFVADSYLQQAENKINLGSPEGLQSAESMIGSLAKQDRVKLTPEQLDRLDGLRTNLISEKNRKTEADKDLAREQEMNLFAKMLNNNLTKLDVLTADKVNPTTLRAIWSQYEDGQAAQLRGEYSVAKDGDPIARTKLLSMIDLHPEKVSVEDIYANAQYIGYDHVTSIVDRLERNQKEKDPVARTQKASLSIILDSGLLGEKDDPETYEKYVQKNRELDDFLAGKPTPEQADKFFGSLIRKDMTKGWLRKSFGIASWSLKNLTAPGWMYQIERAAIEKQFKGDKDSMPAPKTQAEYDAIPKGTLFIDDDGVIARKE